LKCAADQVTIVRKITSEQAWNLLEGFPSPAFSGYCFPADHFVINCRIRKPEPSP
jgi:hypothetical protein